MYIRRIELNITFIIGGEFELFLSEHKPNLVVQDKIAG